MIDESAAVTAEAVEILDAVVVDEQSPAPQGSPCDACGSPVELGDKFCPACGCPQPTQTVPVAAELVDDAGNVHTGREAIAAIYAKFVERFPGAKMELDIEVFDAIRGKKIYSRTIQVTDPSGREDPLTDLTSFSRDPVIERKLIREAAERIGQDLYGYYQEGG